MSRARLDIDMAELDAETGDDPQASPSRDTWRAVPLRGPEIWPILRYAAFVRSAITPATTSPNEAGVGTMMTPASFRISTFS